MKHKPHDLLEFLRQSTPSDDGLEPPPPPPPVERREQSTAMVVLRRSQIVVAATAAGLALILVFLLGLGLGGSSEDGAAPAAKRTVWGIRVASYSDTERGREMARVLIRQLEALAMEEVTLQRIGSQGVVVVMLGSWLKDPQDNENARLMLARVQNMAADGKKSVFPDARFWSIQR